jgi:D-alanyl-D-alanine carboxypeptidase
MQTAYVRLRALAGAFSFGLALALSGQAGAVTAAIVLDAESGRVLQSSNADDIRYPASLTKIMTLYLAFDALKRGEIKLTDRFTVSKNAADMPPTKLGLLPGETIKVEDAILGLVTKSANDAAAVVAENLAGSESRFAELMTRKAHQLGMTETRFRNASGLPDEDQVTTARDMATLALAVMRDLPEYYSYFSRESFTFRGRTHRNHNHLLSQYEGTDGIKTGYIRASGFNLVASSKRGDTRLIGVVLGGKTARSRDAAMQKLLDRTFAQMSPSMETAVAAASRKIPTKVAESRKLGLISSANAGERTVKPAAKGAAGWAIQVGAYRNHRAAEKRGNAAADLIPGVMPDISVSIESARDKKGEVYRARIVGLERDEAADACRLLKRKGFGCMIVPPAKADAVAGGNTSRG